MSDLVPKKRRGSLRGLARSLSSSLRENPFTRDRPASGRPSSSHASSSKWPGSDFPAIAATGKQREYVSNISGNWIVESSGPSKVLIADRYSTSTLVTIDVKLRETSIENSIAALDTAACASFIWAYEARTKFSPSKILSAPSPIEFSTAGGLTYASEYVIADLYLPCIHNHSQGLAKTTAVLFLREDPLPGGVEVLLGMDYINDQSISILIPLEAAIIGRCGNAQIPLTFESRQDWPLRRRDHARSQARKDGRKSYQVLIITSSDGPSGKSPSNIPANHTPSAALPGVPSAHPLSAVMTPMGPHPNPLRSNPVGVIAVTPGPSTSGGATTLPNIPLTPLVIDFSAFPDIRPTPSSSNLVPVVAPLPSATDDGTVPQGPYVAPIHSGPDNKLVRVVSIPARPRKMACKPKVSVSDIPERTSSRPLEPPEPGKTPEPSTSLSIQPDFAVDTKLHQGSPNITLPIVKYQSITVSDKTKFNSPRPAPKAPTKKVFVRAGRIIRKTVSKVMLRKEGNALTASDISVYGSSEHSASTSDNESLNNHHGKGIKGSPTISHPDLEAESNGKIAPLSERVISPYTRASQIDPITAARYGAEEDAIRGKKTWI